MWKTLKNSKRRNVSWLKQFKKFTRMFESWQVWLAVTQRKGSWNLFQKRTKLVEFYEKKRKCANYRLKRDLDFYTQRCKVREGTCR